MSANLKAVRTKWYLRNGTQVTRKHVEEAKARAVHAKRYGSPASPHALPGMSAQPQIADAYEKMRLEDWADHTGHFVFKKFNP